MGNLIVKAKGLQRSHMVFMSVCDILLAVIGVCAIFFSQMKHSTQAVSFTTSSGYSLGSGTFGGGYVLKEDARNTIMIIGIVLIVLALVFLESVFFSNKSYICVYDDRVEGLQNAAFFIHIKKPFDLTYDKINNVQIIKAANSLNTDKIVIYSGTEKYMIVANGSEKVYEVIKNKI